MNNFTYYQPQSVAQALPLLENRWGRVELLAGGTDLLDRLKEYVSTPERIVSLTAIEGPFREISAIPQAGQPPKVTIGAGVRLVDIAESKLLAPYPALTTAAAQIAGPQIRNMGTLGGSLCQRNRCWYFRDTHIQCLLKGGRKCYAHEGENQFHAIFTQGHPCVIVHPSTLAPPLIALGATAQIVSPRGNRELPLEKMFQAPTKPDQREHTLAPDEILLSVTVAPNLPPGTRLANASYEVKQKVTSDWPLVQAAVAFAIEPGSQRARNVRIVLGHVAPTPLLSPEAAQELEGKVVTEATAATAAAAAIQGARPLSQNGYKVPMLKAAVKRAILLAAGFKPDWE
ncbi:MAG: FAD binding domain-containing protein [Gemmataceae bacterium]|nr:FAD binding domain-containing protein [Gemmataceae bacterium]